MKIFFAIMMVILTSNAFAQLGVGGLSSSNKGTIVGSDTTTMRNYSNSLYRAKADTMGYPLADYVAPIVGNGGFEAVGTGTLPDTHTLWTSEISGSSNVRDTSEAHSGSHAVALYVISSASSKISKYTSLTIGRAYTVKFWAKATEATGLRVGDNAVLTLLSLTTAWQQFSVTWVCGGTTFQFVRVDAGTYQIVIDDVQLYEVIRTF